MLLIPHRLGSEGRRVATCRAARAFLDCAHLSGRNYSARAHSRSGASVHNGGSTRQTSPSAFLMMCVMWVMAACMYSPRPRRDVPGAAIAVSQNRLEGNGS